MIANAVDPFMMTRSIIQEAKKKKIKVTNLTKTVYTLSKNGRSVTFIGPMPDTTSAVAYRMTSDKLLTNRILKNNFPFPALYHYTTLEDAAEFLEQNKKIVIKPRSGMHGKGVTVGITDPKKIPAAVKLAAFHDPQRKVLLEQYCPGDDRRILVIGKKVFVIRRMPAHVVGDGKTSLGKLFTQFNEIGDEYRYPVPLDEVTRSIFKEQSVTLRSVPKINELIWLRRTANVKSGGLTIDETDRIHPAIAKKAIRIAQKLKLDIAGIDIISEDISKNTGMFIEVNASPGLFLHMYPTNGTPRNIPEEIVKLYFPDKITA